MKSIIQVCSLPIYILPLIRPTHLSPPPPPPILVNILKKIEKNEYVSFEDLHPSTPSASTPREEHFIDIDVETSALRLRQKEKNKKLLI